uniref:Secreted protein n=1 Tax=Plectus sambesii TaxID=2011161 RepID=A0A914VP58_9BILA
MSFLLLLELTAAKRTSAAAAPYRPAHVLRSRVRSIAARFGAISRSSVNALPMKADPTSLVDSPMSTSSSSCRSFVQSVAFTYRSMEPTTVLSWLS